MPLTQSRTRRELRDARRNLSAHEQRAAAQSIRRLAVRNLTYLRARHIGFYAATGEELSLWPLLSDAAASGKQCYLPVITDRLMRFEPAPLGFFEFDPRFDTLVTNRYGIAEPGLHQRRRRRVDRLDVLFVPLVGFDRSGQRIGMGQGFYDRTLAGIHRRYRRPLLVGCGYSVQEVETIETNPWDVPLDAILTEREWIRAGL